MIYPHMINKTKTNKGRWIKFEVYFSSSPEPYSEEEIEEKSKNGTLNKYTGAHFIDGREPKVEHVHLKPEVNKLNWRS